MKNISTLLLIFALSTILLSCAASEKAPTKIDEYILLNWRVSPKYTSAPFRPPNDNLNNSWSHRAYNDSFWSSNVPIPDLNWGCDICDRYYRGYFSIDTTTLADHNYTIEFASDDGIRIYVNGNFIGQYGGAQHQSGCVNITQWHCSINQSVSPININNHLIQGQNVIAAHVSEDHGKEYFNLSLRKKVK